MKSLVLKNSLAQATSFRSSSIRIRHHHGSISGSPQCQRTGVSSASWVCQAKSISAKMPLALPPPMENPHLCSSWQNLQRCWSCWLAPLLHHDWERRWSTPLLHYRTVFWSRQANTENYSQRLISAANIENVKSLWHCLRTDYAVFRVMSRVMSGFFRAKKRPFERQNPNVSPKQSWQMFSI